VIECYEPRRIVEVVEGVKVVRYIKKQESLRFAVEALYVACETVLCVECQEIRGREGINCFDDLLAAVQGDKYVVIEIVVHGSLGRDVVDKIADTNDTVEQDRLDLRTERDDNKSLRDIHDRKTRISIYVATYSDLGRIKEEALNE